MSTKKVVRKVVAKKVVKSTKKVARAKQVSGVPVTELFTTQETAEPIIQVPANSVALFVNGRDKGVIDTHGKKFKDFVVAQAEREGIRSFTVYADGIKTDTSWAEKSMSDIAKVELVTKDSRG